MKYFLLLQLIIIFINFLYSIQIYKLTFLNENCTKTMDQKSKESLDDSNINFLLEIMKGKIPIKAEESSLNNFDVNLITKLNKNITCVYKLDTGNNGKNMTGLFLGAGINLLNYKSTEINDTLKSAGMINTERRQYIRLMKAIENGTEESIISASSAPFKSIDLFNSAVMSYSIKKNLSLYQNNKYKSPLMNALLSVYFSLYQGDKDFTRYLGMSATYSSYIIEHLSEVFPFTRLIQSKLIFMMDGNFKYNRNHIFFIVPLYLFDDNDFNRIKDIINLIYNNLNINYQSNSRISILGINKDNNCSSFIINYKIDTNNLDNFFKTTYKNKEENINLDIIYENLEKLYNKNIKEDYFENKIAILFTNYNSKFSVPPHKLLNIFDEYKKMYNIQTIPIINNAGLIDNKNTKDIFQYNIFYNFSDYINLSPLRLAISYMHINIDLSEKDHNETQINNINLNDIDSQIYIEVNINNEKNKLEYYEISFDIKKTSGYNIFISDKNPYPSIRNHTNNFLKFENNNKPILRIKKAYDNETRYIDKFYIWIEGILFFNISITKKISENETEHENLILSYGEYENVNYDAPAELRRDGISLQTFNKNNKNNSDYRIYSNRYKNASVENMTKYFLRGIELENTNDDSFLNYELFLFLYGSTHLINRVYKDQNNNYYIGRFINMTESIPNDLKSAGFDKLFINKLYLFFNIDSKLSNSAPPIVFNDKELKTIFDMTYSQYLSELLSKAQRYPNCKSFDEQTPTMRFIIFCLYFSYYYDKNIIKNVVNLYLKEPKYSEVLNFLKDKKQESDTFLINLISQMEQEDKLEKIMVSLIIGKSLALSDIGINFTKGFYNLMGKTKTKIALSVYDTVYNNIKNIIPFFSTSNTKLEEITKYNKSSYDSRNKYNKTQKMDFGKIVNFGLSQFSNYDNGIKKKIIILCDENITKDNYNYYINNELTNYKDNKKHKKLIGKQIDILLITSKNIEKGEIPDFFNKDNNNINNEMPYSIYDNYFHVSNLSNIYIYMDALGKVIKNSEIKMYSGKRFINDFYQGKITYYEINYSQGHVVIIKTNIKKFNIFCSRSNPFPIFQNNSDILKMDEHSIVFSDQNNSYSRIFLGFQPNNTLQKQRISIFTCESYGPNKNCQSMGENRSKWLVFFFLLFGFTLLFIIYKCKNKLSSELSPKNKKLLNVFDTVK